MRICDTCGRELRDGEFVYSGFSKRYWCTPRFKDACDRAARALKKARAPMVETWLAELRARRGTA